MVTVLASVDRGSRPDRVKPKNINMVFIASPLSTQLSRERANTVRLGTRLIIQSGATCLSADCCASELARVGIVLIGPHHHLTDN